MLEYGFAWTGIERTVEEKAECVVQFLDKNIALNVLCAMAAFFLPATIMCGLYLRLVLTIYLYKYSHLMELSNSSAGVLENQDKLCPSKPMFDVQIYDKYALLLESAKKLAKLVQFVSLCERLSKKQFFFKIWQVEVGQNKDFVCYRKI